VRGHTDVNVSAIDAADGSSTGTRVPQMSSVKAPAISAMHNSMTNVRVRTPCWHPGPRPELRLRNAAAQTRI